MTAKTDKKTDPSKAAAAAKASADKAAAAQATADKAAAALAAYNAAATAAKAAAAKLEKAAVKDGATVTVKAFDAAPSDLASLAKLDKPQIQLGMKVNAVRIQPNGEPQTVYVAGLVGGEWQRLAKCGVPANAPGVVKIPGGALAFSKAGGGDIVLVACRL